MPLSKSLGQLRQPVAIFQLLSWLAITSCVSCFLFSTARADSPRRPNVILFLVDDMGWTGPRSFGGDLHETPNIDRLVSQGMKFTSAYAACPVCSPSRAAILTGKYPARLHTTDWIPGGPTKHALKIPDWKPYLDHDEVTIAEALKTAGYHTASIGKWHLGDPTHYPETHGFDVNIAGTYFHSPPRDGGRYFLPNSLFPDAPQGQFLTDRLTDEAIKLIKQWRDEPFFIYFPYYAVHDPVMGKPEYIEHYRGRLKPGMRQFKPSYAALTQSVDDSIGRVLQTLRELHIDDRTIIIFTSDNGGQLDHTVNTPLRDGKASCYEGGVRVPMAIKWPGVTHAGSSTSDPVMGIDLYPTILEMVGVPGDSHHNRHVDGVSLAPLLRNPATHLPARALYWHYPHYNRQRFTMPFGAMRDGDWRLIVHYVDMSLELYNLKSDVGESHNLADERPEHARQMLARFQDWLKSVNAQMPTPDPDYVPGTPPVWPWGNSRNPAKPVDLSAAIQQFAPGWTVTNCRNAMNPGLRKRWGDREHVLVTHPLNKTTPCVLTREVTVAPSGTTKLLLDVAHDPRGDWQLVVKANGTVLSSQEVSRRSAPHVWRTITVDLTPFRGRTITLTLENRANDWQFEAAFWSRIEIEHK